MVNCVFAFPEQEAAILRTMETVMAVDVIELGLLGADQTLADAALIERGWKPSSVAEISPRAVIRARSIAALAKGESV